MQRGNRLYELRKSRRLTQVALSMRLNISVSRISAYENGDNIPCDTLKLLANFYGVSIDYILGRPDDKFSGTSADLHVSEKNLVEFYQSLSDEGKKIIDGMVRGYFVD